MLCESMYLSMDFTYPYCCHSLYYGKLSIIKGKAIECRIEKRSWTSKFYSILFDWIVYLLVPKMLHSNLPIMLHSYGSSPILMHLIPLPIRVN